MTGSSQLYPRFQALVLSAAIALGTLGFPGRAWPQITDPKVVSEATGTPGLRRVLWVSTLNPEHSFWSEHLRFSRAAAKDLGFILEPVFLHQSQAAYRQLLDGLGAAPDFAGAVLPNLKNQGPFVVGKIRGLEIPTVSNVVPMDFDGVGHPDPNSSWIAELRPDEVDNGAKLLRHLVRDARQRGLADDQGRVSLIAIAGSRTDTVGQARLRGFREAVQNDGNIKVHQVFNAEYWSRAQSRKIMATALQRYPDTTVIWSANDDIAIGALTSIREAGRDPATEFAVGGIDATPEMLRLIEAGDATVTIAGLSLHGAWSLIVLDGHLRGKLSPPANGVMKITSDVVDAVNVQRYIDLFEADEDDMDFLAIAAAVQAQPTAGLLSLDTLFAQLRASRTPN